MRPAILRLIWVLCVLSILRPSTAPAALSPVLITGYTRDASGSARSMTIAITPRDDVQFLNPDAQVPLALSTNSAANGYFAFWLCPGNYRITLGNTRPFSAFVATNSVGPYNISEITTNAYINLLSTNTAGFLVQGGDFYGNGIGLTNLPYGTSVASGTNILLVTNGQVVTVHGLAMPVHAGTNVSLITNGGVVTVSALALPISQGTNILLLTNAGVVTVHGTAPGLAMAAGSNVVLVTNAGLVTVHSLAEPVHAGTNVSLITNAGVVTVSALAMPVNQGTNIILLTNAGVVTIHGTATGTGNSYTNISESSGLVTLGDTENLVGMRMWGGLTNLQGTAQFDGPLLVNGAVLVNQDVEINGNLRVDEGLYWPSGELSAGPPVVIPGIGGITVDLIEIGAVKYYQVSDDDLGSGSQLGSENLTNWSDLPTNTFTWLYQHGDENLTNWANYVPATYTNSLLTLIGATQLVDSRFSAVAQYGNENITNWGKYPTNTFTWLYQYGTNTLSNWAQLDRISYTNALMTKVGATQLLTGIFSASSNNIWSGSNWFASLGLDTVTVSTLQASNVIYQAAPTLGTVTVDVGAAVWTVATNSAFTLAFSGTPEAGTVRSILITNSSASPFTVTIPSSYDIPTGAYVTAVTAPASSISQLQFYRAWGIWILSSLGKTP